MKLAILLTGNLRTYELVGPITKSIFSCYDVDYFCSIDLCNTYQCVNMNPKDETDITHIEKVKTLFNPKKIYTSNGCPFDWTTILKLYPTTVRYDPVNSNLSYNKCLNDNLNPYVKSDKFKHININITDLKRRFYQYYFVYKCYVLFYQYHEETKTQYDLVIRLRFDQFLFNHQIRNTFNQYLSFNNTNIYKVKELASTNTNYIKLPHLNDNEIALFGSGDFGGYLWVNDQFWITNFNTAKLMFEFYLHLFDIFKDSVINYYPCRGVVPEHFLAKYLLKNKIKVVLTPPDICGIFIRQLETKS